MSKGIMALPMVCEAYGTMFVPADNVDEALDYLHTNNKEISHPEINRLSGLKINGDFSRDYLQKYSDDYLSGRVYRHVENPIGPCSAKDIWKVLCKAIGFKENEAEAIVKALITGADKYIGYYGC